MSTAALLLSGFASSDLDRRAYSVSSSISGLTAQIKGQANLVRLAYLLYGANHELSKLFNGIDDIRSGKVGAAAATEPLDAVRLHQTLDNVSYSRRAIEHACELLRRGGLSKNTLTATPFRALERHGELMADLEIWLEAVAEDEAFEPAFERSQAEKARGELVELSKV